MDEVIEILEKNATEQIRIGITEFHGHDLAYVRVFFHNSKCGDLETYLPTKKGLTVNIAMLPEIIQALQKAEQVAVNAGLLEIEGRSRRGGYRPGAGRKKGSGSAEVEPDHDSL